MKKLRFISGENTIPLLELVMLISGIVIFVVSLYGNLPNAWIIYIRNIIKFIHEISIFGISFGSFESENINIIIIWEFLIIYFFIRVMNKFFLLNRSNVYHDYCYQWYWICSKILGIKKCNFVNIPIYMQMKLVINQVFDTPVLFEEDYPKVEEPAVVERKNQMSRDKTQECNLILEDTYQISYKQIPKEKQSLYTIKVSRYNPQISGRHYSQSFVQKIMDVVNKLDKDTTINLYATTNPQNTLHIARCAFTMANRGNIAHLVIFQQSASQGRHFENMGIKIY